jgi:hypothetical protein
MVKHAEAWLPAVYTRLFHENPAYLPNHFITTFIFSSCMC